MPVLTVLLHLSKSLTRHWWHARGEKSPYDLHFLFSYLHCGSVYCCECGTVFLNQTGPHLPTFPPRISGATGDVHILESSHDKAVSLACNILFVLFFRFANGLQ